MKILVIDSGIGTCYPIRFFLDGHKVYFYREWWHPFPVFSQQIVGEGITGKKIKDYALYLDKVDFIFFTDCGHGHLVDYLKKNKYKVIGASALAEQIELNKYKFHQLCKELGLARPKTFFLKGIPEVLKFFKDKEGEKYYIKLGYYARGDLETHGVSSYAEAETILESLRAKILPFSSTFPFIIEEEVKGVEIGVDTFVAHGKVLSPIFFTFERYDNTLAKLEDLEKSVWNKVLKKFEKFLTYTDYTGFFSLEGIYNGEDIFLLDPTCYDEETEILTKTGWKRIKDVKKGELVATLNPKTHELEYHPVKRKIEYDYEGDMIEIKSNKKHTAIDLLVTPDHDVYCSKKKNRILKPSDYTFIKAENLRGTIRLKRTAIWKGQKVEYFILDEYRKTWKSGKENRIIKTVIKPAVVIKMEDWLEFLGLYLAEGSKSLKSQTITISQKQKCKEAEAILYKLPFSFVKKKHPNQKYIYQIRDQRLMAYLKQFGKAGEKYVPDFVKELAPEQIERFLYGFWVGDGGQRHKNTNSRQFYTTSKRLADDIQELLLKIGNVGFITIKKQKGTICKIGGRKYFRKNNLYIIRERTIKKDSWADGRLVRKKYYKGKVYCVEVPPNHIIYVRRNGIPVWNGNCRPAYPSSSAIICQSVPDLAELLYYMLNNDINKCQKILETIENRYFIGINVYSEENYQTWLLVHLKKGAKFWPRRVVFVNNRFYITPASEAGEALMGVVVGEGRTLDECYKDADKQLDKVNILGMTINWGVKESFITDYVKPLKKHNIIY